MVKQCILLLLESVHIVTQVLPFLDAIFKICALQEGVNKINFVNKQV